ncbi:pyridoxal phosphate-dependent aminotransferase [Pelomicrobium methylotrophicum]|uniref:Aminotransferase n=1 Tax=Pelomicrobium methylotrophicum TaxID=2602750 RepID=A0A5C7EF77_9PROT|nr:pyridoxal phosphate-dependent aminotransferase [Pelomicrobium methylotrophicum]TXF10536.1 pyridoxal phosphate-dependent aminotransferase [Pelomicrobium methylotrophicum]
MSRQASSIARRMSAIRPFQVMELLARAKALEAQGRSIVHMEIGEPDFDTPAPVVAAARRVLDKGSVPYASAAGLPALREAIAEWYRARYGVEVAPSRILVTPGSSGALLLAAGVLLDPGDRVLMADPSYPCNRNFVRFVGAESVGVPVGPETAYQLSPALIDAHWSETVRMVMLASPSNPTGTTIAPDALRAIVEQVQTRGARLIVDEIYHGLTYGRELGTALAVSPEVFVINSFSKYFGMTGWRIGWLVCPESYRREAEKLAQNIFISASTLSQQAAMAAFTPECVEILEARRREFQRRRDFLVPALRALGFDIPVVPEGAFYVYAGCSRLTDDSDRFCFDLLERAGVAVTPGTDFGEHRARGHVRFAYTTSLEHLEEGVERLRRFLG